MWVPQVVRSTAGAGCALAIVATLLGLPPARPAAAQTSAWDFISKGPTATAAASVIPAGDLVREWSTDWAARGSPIDVDAERLAPEPGRPEMGSELVAFAAAVPEVDAPMPAPLTADATADQTAPAVAAGASEPATLREWVGYGLKWTNWSRMTGDWRRARTDLENRGLSLQVGTISDVSGLADGSSRSQGVGRQLTTIQVTFDLEKIAGLKGSRVLVRYQNMGGANGTFRAGDSQGFSNIDADAFSRFGEVWFEQQIGPRFRVKSGLIDANTEFAFVENGAEFINSSMGFSPTIFPLPTYPDPHIGLVVHADPTDRAYAAAGVFNGGPAMGVADFHALFAMGEVGTSWKGWGGGRAGIGYWHVGGQRADPDDTIQPVATSGEYLVVDQTLWADGGGDGARSIGAFLQAGVADPRMSTTSSHIGGGLVARGLVAGRPLDAMGVGLTAAGLVTSTPGDPRGRHEMDLDAFYRFALAKWVALKPDLQIIRHPGGELDRRPLMAGTIRIEIGF